MVHKEAKKMAVDKQAKKEADKAHKEALEQAEKEIIVADDGSYDDTPAIIADKHKQHPCITKVHTSLINLGKGAGTYLLVLMYRLHFMFGSER